MVKKTILSFLLFSAFFVSNIAGQIEDPIKWTFKSQQLDGNKVKLLFEATIKPKWHLYGINISGNGPVPTSFFFNDNKDYQLIDSIIQVTKPEIKYDQNFEMDLELFSDKAIFQQIISIASRPAIIEGAVEFMSCSDNSCLPPKSIDFKFAINNKTQALKADKQVIDKRQNLKPMLDSGQISEIEAKKGISLNPTKKLDINDDIVEKETDKESRSLWLFIIISFLAGLAGILTPCVFPMIPMTVSFFMQGQKSRMRSIFEALLFGFSVIFIYTAIGIIVSLTSVNANFAQQLSTHWIPNLIFFSLFLVFAFSFFGAFEIILPSSLANRTDKQVDKGGYLGVFFMALTLVLVSFSCTGPIVGALLVEAAGGLAVKPIIGMFAFGMAFALPFTLLAAFPSALKKLPKSGGWLNAVKVVLAFIILAFGLKFLSNIDQAYNLNLLPRPVFLALWISIFLLMGLYLIGKIKFPHDSELKSINITRIMLAILAFAFVVYLIPGMLGAPLKLVDALIPPRTGMEYSIMQSPKANAAHSGDHKTYCGHAKYSESIHLPYGLKGYYDYSQGLACAKKLNKPVFIDFTAHTCSNCKEMKSKIWPDPRILERLRKDFVVISLYVDDKTKLPEEEWVKSVYDGKTKKTLGKKNADIQITKYKANTQPYYVITDTEGKKLIPAMGHEKDVEKMIKFLEKGKKKYNDL